MSTFKFDYPIVEALSFLTTQIWCIYCCQRKWVAVGVWHVHMSETKATTHSTCLYLQNTHTIRTTPLMTSTYALYVQRMLGLKWFWDALEYPCNRHPIRASIFLQSIFPQLLRFMMKLSMYHSSLKELLIHFPPVFIVCWFQPEFSTKVVTHFACVYLYMFVQLGVHIWSQCPLRNT